MTQVTAQGDVLTQPFPADDDDPIRVDGQVAGALADAPPGDRRPVSSGGPFDHSIVVLEQVLPPAQP
jgi:hypothetical protein